MFQILSLLLRLVITALPVLILVFIIHLLITKKPSKKILKALLCCGVLILPIGILCALAIYNPQMVLVSIGSVGIIFFIIHIYKQHQTDDKECEIEINPKVAEASLKVQELNKLNETIKFNPVNTNIRITKKYDNKYQYNKIEPLYLIEYELRSKIDYYAQYIRDIQENRNKKIMYNERVKEILAMSCHIDFESIGISEDDFKKQEMHLFNQLIAPNFTDCTFVAAVSYSSPKRRVNLSKEDEFNLDQIVSAFKRVSPSFMDRKTFEHIAMVERGEVTNSLRYDIMNRDHFKCVICGASAKDGAQLHVDHIVPIAKGGKSVPSNLRTLCEGCNLGKSDKTETGFSN